MVGGEEEPLTWSFSGGRNLAVYFSCLMQCAEVAQKEKNASEKRRLYAQRRDTRRLLRTPPSLLLIVCELSHASQDSAPDPPRPNENFQRRRQSKRGYPRCKRRGAPMGIQSRADRRISGHGRVGQRRGRSCALRPRRC